MTNTQIIFQFFGWGFLLYLSNRTLKRTELGRLKDQLIDQIESIPEWLENEIYNGGSNLLDIETAYYAKLSRIDLLFQQINRLNKFKILKEEQLVKLWDLDIFQLHKNQSFLAVKILQQDIVESIEVQYHKGLYKNNIIRILYLKYKPELLGAFFALSILYFIYEIIKILYS